MNCLRLFELWDSGFESHSRHGCLCAFILYVCGVLFVGSVLATVISLERALPTLYRLRNWKKKNDQDPTKDCSAIDRWIEIHVWNSSVGQTDVVIHVPYRRGLCKFRRTWLIQIEYYVTTSGNELTSHREIHNNKLAEYSCDNLDIRKWCWCLPCTAYIPCFLHHFMCSFAIYATFACEAITVKHKSDYKGIIFITCGALSKYDKCTYDSFHYVKFAFYKDFQNWTFP
jgi:hypothetical protein